MKFLVIGGIDLSQNKETEIQLQYIEKCKELLAKSSTKRPTFHIQNEGCQMNSIQTESIAAIMEKMGYEMVDTEDADAVVFNTCTVRENANQKIYGHLGHLKSIKRNHPDMKIVLFGCMMQEHHVVEKIRKDYKYVNLVFGTHNIHKFPELFYRALQTDDQIIDIWKESDEIVEGMPTSRKYSFKTGVSVMFGCNNFCSYCIVPYVRGREKSREPQAIIREIEELVADGVTEIMLLGQNVNSYGKTLETPVTFSQLLKEVEKIEGLRRIRFMTSHPKDLSDELIQTMKELAGMKEQFVKVQAALEAVKGTGYGVVVPELSEITIEEPEVIRQGNKFGVKIRSKSPSIHMIRAGIETEIAPIVGTEQQAEDLIKYIKESPDRGESIWETNIFGKSIQQLVEDGIKNKLAMISEESQVKLQDTMQKIVNDSKGGLVCIII